MADIAEVRVLVGDNEPDDLLLEDWIVGMFLEKNNDNSLLAAADCADAIAAKFARKVDVQVDDVKLSNSQKHTHYTALAKRLRQQAALASGMPVSTGASETPFFTRLWGES